MVNKIRRSELFQKEKKEKSFEKAKRRKKRQMIREELGEEGAPPLQKPRTIENTVWCLFCAFSFPPCPSFSTVFVRLAAAT